MSFYDLGWLGAACRSLQDVFQVMLILCKEGSNVWTVLEREARPVFCERVRFIGRISTEMKESEWLSVNKVLAINGLKMTLV